MGAYSAFGNQCDSLNLRKISNKYDIPSGTDKQNLIAHLLPLGSVTIRWLPPLPVTVDFLNNMKRTSYCLFFCENNCQWGFRMCNAYKTILKGKIVTPRAAWNSNSNKWCLKELWIYLPTCVLNTEGFEIGNRKHSWCNRFCLQIVMEGDVTLGGEHTLQFIDDAL